MKTVLITGAAKGIGKAISTKFANLGYKVVINYNRSEELAKKLQEELLKINKEIYICQADITKIDDVNRLVDFTLENCGSIDVLVNNAGISKANLFIEDSIEDMNSIIAVNLMGTLNVTQTVLKKYMVSKKDGTIINLSSIWGITGASCEVMYSTTKSAIIGFTKALAKEMGPSNIRVNTVAPGFILTDMTSNLTEEEINDFREKIPLERVGNVEDIAGVVTFLASDDASYITGQVISPNGGVVI